MMPDGGVGWPDPTRVARDEGVGSVVTWLDPGEPVDGPLSGLDLGIKDNIAVAGAPRTCASAFFLDDVQEADAAVVARLRAAGARITATLDMAEFAVGVTSLNSVHGGPRNPWDLRRVAAGSSGGSGAAVAAGVVDAALGTDTGGSIRLPASVCGITGLRPTPGRIDQAGIVPVSPIHDTVGPMARDAATVARIFAVMHGAPLPEAPERLRIGVPRRFVDEGIDPAITQAVDRLLEVLADAGHEVVPVEIPLAEHAQQAVVTRVYADLAAFHAHRLAEAPERFQSETLARISLGAKLSADEIAAAEDLRLRFLDGMAAVFSEVDAIVTPTLPVDVPEASRAVDVLERTRRMGQLTYPWSLHDGPTLAVPIGFHPVSGMPMGAQITTAADAEHVALALGLQHQAATDFHRQTPPGR